MHGRRWGRLGEGCVMGVGEGREVWEGTNVEDGGGGEEKWR